MGNTGGKKEIEEPSNGESGMQVSGAVTRVQNDASDCMVHSPRSPGCSVSPLFFAPQVPLAPLCRADGPPLNPAWHDEFADRVPCHRVPTIISWHSGGSTVAVEGSWDNWTSRRQLQRTGKDHSILLVLPPGVYHYKFFVDGDWRYIPDLPFGTDEFGGMCNILNVNNDVPENLDSVAEFEAPCSPESTYNQTFPPEVDFAKEPAFVPPQLQLTVLDADNYHKTSSSPSSSSKPRHVVLNHLYIEKGWGSQSVVAMGMTNRFRSKYVTVVLYKPLRR